MRVEILLAPDTCLRGVGMLEAMIAAAPDAGVDAVVTRKGYRGDCDVLMTYGTGHPIRRPYWKAQRKRGGRCIGWDLGYWHHRVGETYTMRATLDEDHPTRFLRPEPPERWDSQGIELREDARDGGPVLLIGMGVKSARVHYQRLLQWEQAKLRTLFERFPRARVLYRPKKYDYRVKLNGVQMVPAGPIENALRGASLVVCRHSNVAVDACIAGVPVECEDGAAFALYRDNPKPTREQRLEFLRSLSWWQWKPEEAREAWNYLLTRLSD